MYYYQNHNCQNNRSSKIENHDFTRTCKDKLNKRKLKFCQGFRSKKLSEFYNNLINGNDKIIPDEFVHKEIKRHPNFKSN